MYINKNEYLIGHDFDFCNFIFSYPYPALNWMEMLPTCRLFTKMCIKMTASQYQGDIVRVRMKYNQAYVRSKDIILKDIIYDL